MSPPALARGRSRWRSRLVSARGSATGGNVFVDGCDPGTCVCFPRLSHVSTFTSGAAAHELWEALGVPERMGMTQVSTNHCNFPASQRDEVRLSSIASGSTERALTSTCSRATTITADLARWAPWKTPVLE